MTEPTLALPDGRRPMALHTKMLIGFVIGVVGGIAAKYLFDGSDVLAAFITYVTQPIGQVFLRLLFMLVVPLVFSALVLGVIEIGDPRALGRIGMRTLLFVMAVTGIAVTIGLVAVNVIEPGRGLPPGLGESLIAEGTQRTTAMMDKAATLSGMHLLINIVPDNPIRSAASNDLIGVTCMFS